MKKRMKLALFAKLHDCNGDISKQWFVYYSYRDPQTRKLQRFKEYNGINRFDTVEARRAYARKLITKINRKLKSGWDPFDDNDILYVDHFAYRNDKPYTRKKADYSIVFFLNKYLAERIVRLHKKSAQSYTTKIRIFIQWLKDEKLSDLDVG